MTVEQDTPEAQAIPALLLVKLREHFKRRGALDASVPRRLGRRVYRLQIGNGSGSTSVVVKQLDPRVGFCVQQVLDRWLPAMGMAHAAPALIAVAGEPGGQSVWHAYEDLGDRILDERAPNAGDVAAFLDVLADLH